MAVLDALELSVPIFQAPMGGGFTPPGLVAAVSNAGGLGNLGAPYMEPQAILAAVAAVRDRTARPFGVNLFAIAPPAPDPDMLERSAAWLAPVCEELGIEVPALRGPAHPDVAAQIEAVLETRPALFSFTLGIPSPEVLARCRQAGILTCGTATNLVEGEALEAAGVDLICAQGSEAGGHRGTFLGPWEEGMIGILPLVDLLTQRLKTPVIGAGGLMTGRAVRAVLDAGAVAAQLGTAFLDCPEAGTPKPHRRALTSAGAERTGITAAFSGAPARGIINRFMEMVVGPPPAPFPILNALTRGIRSASAAADRPDFMSLWAGQGAPLIRSLTAADLIAALERELEAA